MAEDGTPQTLGPVIMGLLFFLACVVGCFLALAKARAAGNLPLQVVFGVGLAASAFMVVLSCLAANKVRETRRSDG